MSFTKLFSNLVFVFFLILSTGFTFAAYASTRDIEAQDSTTEPISLKKKYIDSILTYPVPIVVGVAAGVYVFYNTDGSWTSDVITVSTTLVTTSVATRCQDAFSKLLKTNKNISKPE